MGGIKVIWKKVLTCVVLVLFLLNWAEWAMLLHQHWSTMPTHSHITGILLLIMYPLPVTHIFVKRRPPAIAALLTYLLLFYAMEIAFP